MCCGPGYGQAPAASLPLPQMAQCMETASGAERGALLTLADYHAWAPNQAVAQAASAKPAQCAATPATAQRAARPDHRPCFACHLGGAESR